MPRAPLHHLVDVPDVQLSDDAMTTHAMLAGAGREQGVVAQPPAGERLAAALRDLVAEAAIRRVGDRLLVTARGRAVLAHAAGRSAQQVARQPDDLQVPPPVVAATATAPIPARSPAPRAPSIRVERPPVWPAPPAVEIRRLVRRTPERAAVRVRT